MSDANGYRNPEAPGSENAKRLDGAQRSQSRESFDGRRLERRKGEVLTNFSTAPQNGFTLVELLVALVIMASLVAVTSVSVETTQNKARADKTAAIGRGVVEALERSDGLSFVSDFGRLPENAEELRFLFSQNVLTAGAGEEEAAAYREIELEFNDGTVDSAFRNHFNNLSPKPVLHAGWRGPYSRATELRSLGSGPDERSAFLDGWRNEWEVESTPNAASGLNEMSALKSPGRDGRYDPDAADWQDEDLIFDLNRSLVTENVPLIVKVKVFDSSGHGIEEGTLTDFTLSAVVFAPTSAPKFATVGYGEKVTASPDSSYSLALAGLTVGHRMVFVFATENGGRKFVGSPRLLHIKPGVQPDETITLKEL